MPSVTEDGISLLNSELNEILDIHLNTPAPDDLPEPHLIDVDEMFEAPPTEKKPHLVNVVCLAVFSFLVMAIAPPVGTILGLLLLCLVLVQYSKMKKKYAVYIEKINEYQKQKDGFIIRKQDEWAEFEHMLSQQHKFADDILAYVLDFIDWPRETFVSYEVNGDEATFDVDLPEVEDMPQAKFTTTPSGQSIKEQTMSDMQIRKAYARHVHGIGFRVIGEAFRALDIANTVIFSGYTQRPDPATGQVMDDYLYSVKVDRDDWEKINFDDLESVDPIEALGVFDIRRNMSKTGIFKSVEPFA